VCAKINDAITMLIDEILLVPFADDVAYDIRS
jgi:hypothetical protein